MKNYFKFFFFICCITLLCNVNLIAQKKPVAKKITKPLASPTVGTIPVLSFKNGIKLKSKGFKVKDAALYFDDNSIVPENNLVGENQRISMLVTIDTGWAIVNGKVYPGASEIIKLNTGYEVLRSEDLFKSYEETGVNPQDAKYITLKAMITKLDDKKKYIVVSFRIWDKKEASEITGSYKFYIK